MYGAFEESLTEGSKESYAGHLMDVVNEEH